MTSHSAARPSGGWGSFARVGVVNADQAKQARRVKQFSKEYFDLAASHGGTLAKYLAFDEPVLVNLANETYLIEAADPAGTP